MNENQYQAHSSLIDKLARKDLKLMLLILALSFALTFFIVGTIYLGKELVQFNSIEKLNAEGTRYALPLPKPESMIENARFTSSAKVLVAIAEDKSTDARHFEKIFLELVSERVKLIVTLTEPKYEKDLIEMLNDLPAPGAQIILLSRNGTFKPRANSHVLYMKSKVDKKDLLKLYNRDHNTVSTAPPIFFEAEDSNGEQILSITAYEPRDLAATISSMRNIFTQVADASTSGAGNEIAFPEEQQDTAKNKDKDVSSYIKATQGDKHVLNLRDATNHTLESILRSRDSKSKVVNFWGTWCAPCRAEMPLLGLLAFAMQSEVEWVGIMYEQDMALTRDTEEILKRLKELKVSSSRQFLINDQEFLRSLNGKTAYPYFLLLDDEGNVDLAIPVALKKPKALGAMLEWYASKKRYRSPVGSD